MIILFLTIIGEAIHAVRKHRSFYVNSIQGSVVSRENYVYITYEPAYFQSTRLWI